MMRNTKTDLKQVPAFQESIDYDQLKQLIHDMEEVAYSLVKLDEAAAARSLFFSVTALEAVCAKKLSIEGVKGPYRHE